MKWLRKIPLGWPLIILAVTVFAAVSIVKDSSGFTAVDDPKQLIALINGNSLKGESIHFYYAPNGILSGNVGSYYDYGKWTLEKDAYCEQWRLWGDGEKICWRVQRKGDQIKRQSVNPLPDSNLPVINDLVWTKGDGQPSEELSGQ